jgi:tetratricopeptide (TPR) repeat protein
VAAAHAGALDGGFHYDDRAAVSENLGIRVWQPLFYLTSPLAVSGEEGASGYRPLTVASFAVNYALGRLDPFGYLLGNLLAHLAVSWMVFVGGRILLRDDRWAAVAAVIYALHPVNAEAVNYVTARASLLAALGALIAFWAFLRRREGGGVWWTVAGLAAFAAALLSKESAVALLPALAVSPWHGEPARGRGPDGTPRGWWVRPILPYVVVCVAYLVVWASVAAANMENRGNPAAYPVWTLMELVGRSLWLWVWPWPLGLDHPLTFVKRFNVILAGVLLVAAIGLATVVLAGRRRYPLLAWGTVWALAGLAPLAPLPWMTVKGLLQENRLTFSAAALSWLTAAAIRGVMAYGSRRAASGETRPMAAWWIRGAAAVGLVGVVGAVAMDRARSAVWNDDVRLWEEAVRLTPESRSAHLNLGVSYMNRQEYDRAEAEFQRALVIAPDYAHAYYALGLLEIRRERYDEAEAFLAKTISLASDYSGSYHALGDVAMKRGRSEAAETAFQHALALNPRDAKAQAKLGLVAQRAGDLVSAESRYRAALEQDPDHAVARNNLGILYIQRRDWPRAFEQFAAAARRDPDDLDAVYNEAITLDMLGRKDEARAILKRLLARLPSDPKFDSHRRGAQGILHQARP